MNTNPCPNVDGTVFRQAMTTWAYDHDGRLTSEALTVLAGGTNAPAAYTDVFKFDLDGNRTEEDLTGSQTATVIYTYDANNALLTETRTGDDPYAITDSYVDSNGVFQNGNLVGQTRTGTNAETDSYTWDLRGRMATATVNGTTTIYTYDTNGVRTSETIGTSPTTYYLNDPNNPTGYTKAVEESTTLGGLPVRSFLFGVQVEAQADSAHGLLFLVHDGHGNTRLLLDGGGTIVEQYNFDAYGNLLASTGAQASAVNALTPWLQGDGLYDRASGWNYNLARWRDGFHWTSMDPALFGAGELANANLYAYVGMNPSNLQDPSGRSLIGDVLSSIGIGGLLVGLGTASFAGVLNARAGGSFWYGLWEGLPGGAAMAALAGESGGVLNPKFAYESFMVAYGTMWGVFFDYVVGYSKHGTWSQQDEADSMISNLRSVALARAFKGAADGKFNKEHPWYAFAASVAAALVAKAPDLLGTMGSNINKWYHGRPTDWKPVEKVMADSALSGLQTWILSSDVSDIFPSGVPEPVTETFKQLATGGWKKIFSLLFS